MSAEFIGALAFVLAGLAFLGALVGVAVVIGRRTIKDAEENGSPVERVLAARHRPDGTDGRPEARR